MCVVRLGRSAGPRRVVAPPDERGGELAICHQITFKESGVNKGRLIAAPDGVSVLKSFLRRPPPPPPLSLSACQTLAGTSLPTATSCQQTR